MSSELNLLNHNWKPNQYGIQSIKGFPYSTVEYKIIRSKQRNKPCNTLYFPPLLEYLFTSYHSSFPTTVKLLYIFSAVHGHSSFIQLIGRSLREDEVLFHDSVYSIMSKFSSTESLFKTYFSS